MTDIIVRFDRPKFERFKRAYEDAVKRGEHVLTFDGAQYAMSYAKYLIEYLESQLKKH